MRWLLLSPPSLPQSDEPSEQRSYRRAMHRWTVRVSFAVLVFGLAASWSLSPWGFAKAADLKAQVDAAVLPISKQVAELNAQVQLNSNRLVRALSEGIASEIRFLASKRCKETDASERERLIREMDRKQGEYRELRNEYYRVPGCEDL